MNLRRLKVLTAHYIATGGAVSYVVDFRGRPACPCLAEWYPVHERELQRRGVLAPGQQIYIFQLIGNAAASSNTHATGGAGDDDQISDEAVWVARQMGADACWARTTGSFANNKHRHLVLTGCPHNGPARYQIDEVRAGGDGLIGNNPDPGPRPLSGRTWREGIEWANEQEDEMTPENFEKIAEITRAIVRDELTKHTLDVGKKNRWTDDRFAETLLSKVNAIAEAVKRK